MKVCYIVLTCEKFIFSRVKWQKNTFFKDVEDKDIYFLAAEKYNFGPYTNNVYGWNTADNYDGCPVKYIRFFQNMTIDYDWYVFIDDDTFLNIKNLNKFLNRFDRNKKYCIGKRIMDTTNNEYLMHGGSGFIISRPIYNELIEYIRNIEDEKLLLVSRHGDHCMGKWLININDIEYIHDDRFHEFMHSINSELDNFFSYHYLKYERDFEFYYNYIKNK